MLDGGLMRRPNGIEPKYEYAETEGLTPPPGKGWVLVSKFGVKVKGGASPSRSS